MDQATRKKVGMGLALLVGLSIVFYLKTTKRAYENPIETERKARMEFDVKTILGGVNQDPGILYRAMFEIARESYPAEVLTRIQGFQGSSEILIRSGVLYALAYQKDSRSKEIVAKMIHDPEATVRSQVLHAARERPGSDRVPLLEEYLSNPQINEVEKIQAKAVLYLSLPKGAQADQVLEELISMVDLNSSSGPSDLAMLQINGIAPGNPRVIALDQKALSLSHRPAVVSAAIRTLAQRNDSILQTHYPSFIRSKESMIKRAAIEGLPLTCPPKRWEWIREGYPLEADFAGRTPWVLAAERLKGEEAKRFLASALAAAEKSRVEVEIKAIQASIARVENSKIPEPCPAR